jgi:hypothetical protein
MYGYSTLWSWSDGPNEQVRVNRELRLVVERDWGETLNGARRRRGATD